MHPAYSVIFFTTASGAGYGLLIWLGLAHLFGDLPANWWFRFIAFGLALSLITAGLLSSTSHLGRPERGMKRVFAMAHFMVVARGRGRGLHLCTGGPVRTDGHFRPVPRATRISGRRSPSSARW